MKAIFFDRRKNRVVEEIDKVTEEFTLLKTDTEVSYKIVYKLEFYNTKGIPIYVEISREQTDVELLK